MRDQDTGKSGRDVVEVNVGYDDTGGKWAAMDAAVTVVREFGSLDVVTVRIPRGDWTTLEDHPEVRYVEENGRSGT